MFISRVLSPGFVVLLLVMIPLCGFADTSINVGFTPATIYPGDPVVLEISLHNSNKSQGLTDAAVTLALPMGLSIATIPDAKDSCGFTTATAVPGGNKIVLTGGNVAAAVADGGCSFRVAVTATTPSTYHVTIPAQGPSNGFMAGVAAVPGYRAATGRAVLTNTTLATASLLVRPLTGGTTGVGGATVSTLNGTPKLTLTHVLTSQSREYPAVDVDTFTLVLTNTGGVPLTDVSLLDALGAGFSPSTLIEVLHMTGTSENGNFDGDNDAELFDSNVTIQPGAWVTFVVRVRVWRDLTVTHSTITASATATELTAPVTADATVRYADTDADGIADGQESPSADRDGDGIPDAQDYDPSGYFYCQDDGKILTGGAISVTGPLGSNSSVGTANGVTIVRDGSDGQFQWYVIAPGHYTMTITYPPTGSASTDRLPGAALDVTRRLPDNPAVLGSTQAGSTGYLVSMALADNPVFYTEFDIQPGDPLVLANNIPITDCANARVNGTKHAEGAERQGGTGQDKGDLSQGAKMHRH